MTSTHPSPHATTRYIATGILLAVLLAVVAPQVAVRFALGGDIFLNLLRVGVVPIVVTSVMSGILGLGDVRRLGRPGAITLAYYLMTTLLAVVVGLAMVSLVQPGVGISTATLEAGAAQGAGIAATDRPTDVTSILSSLVLRLFTDNLFRSAAEADLLPLILFSIVFAAILTTLGERVSLLTRGITQLNDGLLTFILFLMRIAPVGIFCLVAARFGEAQLGGGLLRQLAQTGAYFLTVLVGLGVHAIITLPLVLWLFTRRHPIAFIRQMSQALLTAFSTASSTATLPVTLENAVTYAKVPKRAADFVLPLGATINMDGTALYEAVAAIFIAQASGVDLGPVQHVVVAVTATLAAVGAAGIPEAGLVTMIIVLNAVGLPVEYIGLILSVDWLLDRFRTTVNVFGDAVGAAVVSSAFPE
jgi:solute carrier family 1 (high affinity glutamate transporter) protein 1